MSSALPSFRYDHACPLRDPRTKAYGVPAEDVVLDMAAVICLLHSSVGDGTVYEDQLVGAGFSPAEIERHGAAARRAAAERLAPRHLDAERIAAMADALAEQPASGSDRVNIATLKKAGFPLEAIHSDLDAAVTLLRDRRQDARDPAVAA